MVAEDATVGPTFSIKSLDNATFLLQWVEYLNVSHLGTHGVMAITDDAASFYQGAYASADGPFMNPWSQVGTTAVSATLSSDTRWNYFKNPYNWSAGSVGQLRYHTEDAGVVSDYTTSTGDIGIFWNMQKLKETEYNNFTSAKNKFETDKKTYEDAHAARET